MTRRLVAVILGLAASASLAASPAFAQGYFGGALKTHAHSGAAGDGGAALTPASVIVTTFTASSATITNLTVLNNIPGSVTASSLTATALTVSGTGGSANFVLSGAGGTTNIGNQNNSVQAIGTYFRAGSSFTVCDSTQSFANHGSATFVSISGDAANNTLNEGCMLFLLIDGAFINSENFGQPLAASLTSVVNDTSMLNAFTIINPSPTAAVHNYCWGISADHNGGSCYFGKRAAIQFNIMEIR